MKSIRHLGIRISPRHLKRNYHSIALTDLLQHVSFKMLPCPICNLNCNLELTQDYLSPFYKPPKFIPDTISITPKGLNLFSNILSTPLTIPHDTTYSMLNKNNPFPHPDVKSHTLLTPPINWSEPRTIDFLLYLALNNYSPHLLLPYFPQHITGTIAKHANKCKTISNNPDYIYCRKKNIHLNLIYIQNHKLKQAMHL